MDFSKDACLYFTLGKRKPVTLSLTVLVVIEMFNAMNAISDELSILTVTPLNNLYLIFAITCSMLVHCMILYVPFFNEVFGIMPLDLSEWILVVVFSFPVIIIEEIMKFLIRSFGKNDSSHQIHHKLD